MYHVILIGVISLIVYLLSLIGSKYGILSSKGHRAFWNTILLVTFFITATAGIFLALQSNYKWELQGVGKILSWHVEFGIGLSFTALIHLTWHLGYYKKIFTEARQVSNGDINGEKGIHSRGYFIKMLMILGFLTGVIQVIFLREILNLAGGYEIAAGAVFACWILVSALGARLAGRPGQLRSPNPPALLPLSGLVSFLLYIVLSKLFINEGVTPGILSTLLITGLSLLPFCVLSGYLFVRLSYMASSESLQSAGVSFALETTGSMIAGIIVTLVTGSLMGNFQILLAAILIYYIIYLPASNNRYRILLTSITAVCLIAVFVFKPDTYIRNILLGSVKVTESIDSKYGNIAIAEYKDERNIFYNHRLFEYEADAKQREENIHYAMSQHPSPEEVLIISGGADRHIQEALKYGSVRSVTYIERDPQLLDCTRDTALQYEDVNVRIVSMDAFNYIRRCEEKFDVIISLLGQPDNIVTNRFFTREYFEDIKNIIAPGGVFMIKAGSSSSYISEEESGFLSTVYNSLSDVFHNILPVRGESVYLLASDFDLTTSIPELIEHKDIENIYVNGFYLNDDLIRFNSDQIMDVIDTGGSDNTLDKPGALFYNQKHEMEKAGGKSIPILIGLALLLIIPFISGNKNSRTMYSTSLNLAGTEILALILIQSTAGNFYQLAGLLIAIVMGGLAAGSSSGIKISSGLVNLIPVLLAILAIVFALISPILLSSEILSIPVIVSFIIVFIPALVAGYFYRNKTDRYSDSRSISGIYFADLCGAALGFLLIAGILVPFYGIKTTFYILAFFNFASYITNQVINMTRRIIRKQLI